MLENMNSECEYIISKLKESNFSKEIIENDEKLKTCLFECLKRNDKTELDEIRNEVGKKIDDAIEVVKNKYEDYFCFDFFRNENIELDKRKYILNKIYSKCIIVNDFSNLEFDKSPINKETLKTIAGTLLWITNQCVKNNYEGQKIIKILRREFNVNENVTADLADFYNQNIISLKLDYLIMEINYSSSDD